MDLVLLSCYCHLPPGRAMEIRTLRVWKASTTPLDLKKIRENGWNVLFLAQTGDMSLHFESYKTKKSRGRDETSIEVKFVEHFIIKIYISSAVS